MSQDYFDFKSDLEFEPSIDNDSTKFLNKKCLKDKNGIKKDDNMLLETNDFYKSYFNITNYMDFQSQNIFDRFFLICLLKKILIKMKIF